MALFHTYSALEEEIERNKDHPAFTPLYFPLELHRKAALEKDLEYFYGEGWEGKIQCSEAAQRYVDRIHHVGQNEPELLVAHAYTRYMGDLSGGQVLKKVAQRALKLPSTGEGVQFYIFENISNPQQFKQFYRARLNALDLDMGTKERIVQEANKAFEFNMQVGVAGAAGHTLLRCAIPASVRVACSRLGISGGKRGCCGWGGVRLQGPGRLSPAGASARFVQWRQGGLLSPVASWTLNETLFSPSTAT